MTSSFPPTLALVLAALVVAGTGCGCPTGNVVTLRDEFHEEFGRTACLAVNQEDIRYPLTGLYQYKDSGKLGAPIIELSSEINQNNFATGRFQLHGVTPQAMQWGIVVNDDGVPMGKGNENGAYLYLAYNVLEPGTKECTPGLICNPDDKTTVSSNVESSWDLAYLSLDFQTKEARIYGERIRACPDCVRLQPDPYGPEAN